MGALRCTPEDEVIYKRDWLWKTQAGKIQLFFTTKTTTTKMKMKMAQPRQSPKYI